MKELIKPLRVCRTCGVEAYTREDLEDFVKKPDAPYGRTTECLQCKAYRTKQRDVERRYNISIEEYNRCMETSDTCESCGSSEELCYDHCHVTMKFRGVLCKKCNYGLGLLGDNKQGVLNLMAYITTIKD